MKFLVRKAPLAKLDGKCKRAEFRFLQVSDEAHAWAPGKGGRICRVDWGIPPVDGFATVRCGQVAPACRESPTQVGRMRHVENEDFFGTFISL